MAEKFNPGSSASVMRQETEYGFIEGQPFKQITRRGTNANITGSNHETCKDLQTLIGFGVVLTHYSRGIMNLTIEENKITVKMQADLVRLIVLREGLTITITSDINGAEQTRKEIVLEDEKQAQERFEEQKKFWREQELVM